MRLYLAPSLRRVKYSDAIDGASLGVGRPIALVEVIGGVRHAGGAVSRNIVQRGVRTIFFVGQKAVRRYLVGGYDGRKARPLNFGPSWITRPTETQYGRYGSN